jgi:hypothetical protein
MALKSYYWARPGKFQIETDQKIRIEDNKH